MAEYGIPYMGSKSSICNKLISIFPNADNFYDIFGGGFSVTHAMILRRSRDYKTFHFNEMRPGICGLIQSAIAGEFNYDKFKPRFVSREEFLNKKDADAYIKMVWSFGNGGMSYLFSHQIEPYKKSMHNAVVFNEFDELATKVIGATRFKDGYSVKQKRLFLRNRIEFFRTTKIPEFLRAFLKPEQLQQLERLQQLQQLEQLQRLQQLEFYCKGYDEIQIMGNSVVYCDPPYNGTAEYDAGGFDHKSFLNWCDNQKCPVFISEYEIADKRFVPVFKTSKVSLLSSASRDVKTERVYVNRAGYEILYRINGRVTSGLRGAEIQSDYAAATLK